MNDRPCHLGVAIQLPQEDLVSFRLAGFGVGLRDRIASRLPAKVAQLDHSRPLPEGTLTPNPFEPDPLYLERSVGRKRLGFPSCHTESIAPPATGPRAPLRGSPPLG